VSAYIFGLYSEDLLPTISRRIDFCRSRDNAAPAVHAFRTTIRTKWGAAVKVHVQVHLVNCANGERVSARSSHMRHMCEITPSLRCGPAAITFSPRCFASLAVFHGVFFSVLLFTRFSRSPNRPDLLLSFLEPPPGSAARTAAAAAASAIQHLTFHQHSTVPAAAATSAAFAERAEPSSSPRVIAALAALLSAWRRPRRISWMSICHWSSALTVQSACALAADTRREEQTADSGEDAVADGYSGSSTST